MYKLTKSENKLKSLQKTSFSEIDVWERHDLQEWIFHNPDILGCEDQLLFIAKEFQVNVDISKGIRLDLLALDRDGSLVVIELKRDNTRGDIDWQSIKYAARCSNYDASFLLDIYCRTKYKSEAFNDEQRMSAMMDIFEHIDGDVSNNPSCINEEEFAKRLQMNDGRIDVKILLVAQDFHPDICAAVHWLRDNGIDMSCIRLTPYKDDDNHDIFYIDAEKILPIPEIEVYTSHAINTRRRTQGNIIASDGKRSTFSSDKLDDLDLERLKSLLAEALSRNTNLTPRLKVFLNILATTTADAFIQRDFVIQAFVEQGIAENSGKAGRYLSNVSQFISKPNNAFLRTIIDFDSEDYENLPGARKNKFRIKNEYKQAVLEALEKIGK